MRIKQDGVRSMGLADTGALQMVWLLLCAFSIPESELMLAHLCSPHSPVLSASLFWDIPEFSNSHFWSHPNLKREESEILNISLTLLIPFPSTAWLTEHLPFAGQSVRLGGKWEGAIHEDSSSQQIRMTPTTEKGQCPSFPKVTTHTSEGKDS